jgi:hypothetical protein
LVTRLRRIRIGHREKLMHPIFRNTSSMTAYLALWIVLAGLLAA